jgi:hypothetical protein
LMNDCKYGHKALGNIMELALLRSSIHPELRRIRANTASATLFIPIRATKKPPVSNRRLWPLIFHLWLYPHRSKNAGSAFFSFLPQYRGGRRQAGRRRQRHYPAPF